MTQKLTILFDLDGTLVDTAPDLMGAHNYVMKKFGYSSKSVEDIRNLVGKGASVLIGRSIWGSAKKEFSKVTDDKIKKEMVKEFISYYGKNIVNQSKLIGGVKEFLDWAKSNNISMGVCTNKQEHLSVDLLKKIKIYNFFDYVAGGNTFNHNKPNPKHLTDTIEILGGNVNKTLMVGDSETDSEAAIQAKIKFILVAHGYTEKDEKNIKHDFLINDFNMIKGISEKLLKIK